MGIAGSMVFMVFDRDPLYLAKMKDAKFFDKADSFTQTFEAHSVDEFDTATDKTYKWSTPAYHDQIPPFDISISGANEYGNMAVMSIFGVEILNTGSGMSMEDITMEQQCTWIARHLMNWIPIEEKETTNYTFRGTQEFDWKKAREEGFEAAQKSRYREV